MTMMTDLLFFSRTQRRKMRTGNVFQLKDKCITLHIYIYIYIYIYDLGLVIFLKSGLFDKQYLLRSHSVF
jgi:hypothetical protein